MAGSRGERKREREGEKRRRRPSFQKTLKNQKPKTLISPAPARRSCSGVRSLHGGRQSAPRRTRPVKEIRFFLFWKKLEVELFFFRFSSFFPSLALSLKKNQKTHELRDLDVGLQIALESAEEDLSLARLEPVDHAGDGAAER